MREKLILTSKETTKTKTGRPLNPNHSANLATLRRIKGQIEGIENMILDGRYCPDILQQVKAAGSALKSVELVILEKHIRHCLADAVASGDKKETEKKIKEILIILKRKNL